MPLTAAQRSARARMGAYARLARMSDEERITHARRMAEAHRESFDSDFAYKAHMTGLALRSSRRRTPETPAPLSDTAVAAGRGSTTPDNPLETSHATP
jgi:hypothetical protein